MLAKFIAHADNLSKYPHTNCGSNPVLCAERFFPEIEQVQLIIQNHQGDIFHEIGPRDLTSQLDQSDSQDTRGAALTTQFHQEATGYTQGGGVFQELSAVLPKQAAIHTHHVKVGVTNNLKKFHDSLVPRTHPAQPGIGGQINGIHHPGVGRQFVIAEKIGIHSATFSQSHIGLPKSIGSLPGASGAQFIGLAIQPSDQKPQLNLSDIASTPHK